MKKTNLNPFYINVFDYSSIEIMKKMYVIKIIMKPKES